MPDIITPNAPKQQDVKEQILLNLLNQFNIMSMEIDVLFETICDTEDKKKDFKQKLDAKMKTYLEKVKSAQIKQQIMKK